MLQYHRMELSNLKISYLSGCTGSLPTSTPGKVFEIYIIEKCLGILRFLTMRFLSCGHHLSHKLST